MKRKTIWNLALILLVLSFFVTPLGYESKIILQRIFASSVDILPKDEQYTIDFDWKLKDRDNKEFNFSQSRGKHPAFVYFWSSWRVTSVADLAGIQKLYDDYHQKVDFYVVTNELPAPVEELMQKRGYNFKVTYLIIGEKMPFDAEKIPSGYIVDKQGVVKAKSERIAKWNSSDVRELLDQLL
ncbi:TlpA disulfide reductase family protein [Capnocytophaga sp.]|uniref:TlpA family protein disulfide reductase n=1 Tax=Capnocytophaga sp. TaxID=44737 RepID=UPI0026DB2014|nr:TlpA disulfide reductase family protein [Capnocytophaga sp.]MDO5105309.1 TlpA disulfide reductase family protein [Capnocytophaga sp.]